MRFSVKRIISYGGELRERNHFVGLWLDEKEYGHLNEQCSVTGLSISALVRKLIAGTQLRPRPPDQYAALLRELSAIGNNINQIARKANETNSIYADDIATMRGDVAELCRMLNQFLSDLPSTKHSAIS